MNGDRDTGTPEPSEHDLRADRLLEDVLTLSVDIGPRSVFVPEAFLRAQNLLAERFSSLEYNVRLEGFSFQPGVINPITQETIDFGGEVANVIAEKPGSVNPEEIITLGAHFDTPYDNVPGANDNASGDAVMLEVARILQDFDSPRTIRFVGFANEEPPFTWSPSMGSEVSAQRSVEAGERILAMIALDEIGYFGKPALSPLIKDIEAPLSFSSDSLVFVTYGAGKTIIRRVVETFRMHADIPVEEFRSDAIRDNDGNVWPVFKPAGWSDHKPYLSHDYPALLITDTGPFRYGKYYHTELDRAEWLDYDNLAKTAVALAEVVKSLAVDPTLRRTILWG
jgi:hypothetical protein